MSTGQEPEVNPPGSSVNEAATGQRKELEQTPRTVGGQVAELFHAATSDDDRSRQFLLRVVQPGLAGLMDGSVSTLAPIFATAFATHHSFTAFLVGIASATGAGISMAFS
jgi:rubrerythrin